MNSSMDLGAVDLNLLVALDLLLDERSVRGAARRAHVTPSAMSHTLGRLRDLVGDELLIRAGRGMVLTPRAEALAGPVRDVLAQVRTVLVDPASFDAATLSRAYRLVCTDHVSAVLWPHVDAILRREAPGADLYLRPLLPELPDELRQGSVDVAIGIFPEAPPELRMRRLFADRFVTVARVGHPRVTGPELTLDAFLAEDHLLVSPRGGPTGTVDRLLAERGLARRVARTVPHFLSAIWHVADSDLLLTVSGRLVAAVAPRVPLTVLPTPLPVSDYTMMLTWHPRVDRDPEHTWFRGVLTRAAARLDEPPSAG